MQRLLNLTMFGKSGWQVRFLARIKSVLKGIINGTPEFFQLGVPNFRIYIRLTSSSTSSYLSCDHIGKLSAMNEAISPEESFLCVPSLKTPGTFNIQTAREKYLTVAETSRGTDIRGDAEDISFNSALRIRMQARFKPRLKANKESKAKEKVSRRELEDVVGRRLEHTEVKRLKKARVQGDYHEAILDVRVKGKHDKYS